MRPFLCGGGSITLPLALTLVMATTLAMTVSCGGKRLGDEHSGNRGPGPIDSGDAAARHARTSADGRRGSDRVLHHTPRPEPPHGGWGAKKGHLTRGGAGRDGLGNQRDENAKPVLRRHLLEEASRLEEDAAAAEAAEKQANAVLWPSLRDVPAGLRCSGGGARGGFYVPSLYGKPNPDPRGVSQA